MSAQKIAFAASEERSAQIYTVSATDPLPTTGHFTTKTVTIASGATGLSGAVDLEGYQLAAIQMPATWVAANITLQAATTLAGTYQDVYNDAGEEVAITAAQARCIAVNNNALSIAPLRFVKFRSGTTATPVNQTASRTLTLILKR